MTQLLLLFIAAASILTITPGVDTAMVLRAATRLQGVTGFDLGMQLLTGLLETFWDVIHPELDAEEDDDPTMRLNALSALATITAISLGLVASAESAGSGRSACATSRSRTTCSSRWAPAPSIRRRRCRVR